MNICKDCKYWKALDYGYGEKYTVCDYTKATDLNNDGFEVHAEAADDTGLNSMLITGPNFGCIKFEEKN